LRVNTPPLGAGEVYLYDVNLPQDRRETAFKKITGDLLTARNTISGDNSKINPDNWSGFLLQRHLELTKKLEDIAPTDSLKSKTEATRKHFEKMLNPNMNNTLYSKNQLDTPLGSEPKPQLRAPKRMGR
jgi:hypothetical protein